MKRLVSIFLVFLLLCGCGPQAPSAETSEFFAMDTLMRITVYDGDDQALPAARQEINRLESLFSRTREDSDISRLNEAAGQDTPVSLDAQTLDLLSQAKTYAPVFDITVAPVMDAWGFTRETQQVPSAETLEGLLPLVDASALELDLNAGTARLPLPGMAVDLGGIAKGWAADRLTDILKEHHVTSALLDLGRNITLIGTKPDGTPWRVAVQDPGDSSAQLCILALTDCTLSTSGGYERFFEEDGVIYHHIIDPSTGYPARSDLLSATVISTEGGFADASSTRMFVLGLQGALDFWKNQGQTHGMELILVTADKHIYVTEGLESGFAFEGEANGYTYEIVRR